MHISSSSARPGKRLDISKHGIRVGFCPFELDFTRDGVPDSKYGLISVFSKHTKSGFLDNRHPDFQIILILPLICLQELQNEL